MRTLKSLLVTGGSGFIGSHFINYVLSQPEFAGRIINLDLLTYAGSNQFLTEVQKQFPDRYFFIEGDICSKDTVDMLFSDYEIDTVVNFAAETHVDRSISAPEIFLRTNMLGTGVLLESASAHWEGRSGTHFHQVSTDEVFGTLGTTGKFSETSKYHPNNPYSASKAGADHLVQAYGNTYDMSTTISYSCNNYGPHQHEEKLIPTMIWCMLSGEKLPIYGDGLQVREWLYARDHVEAIWTILTRGASGESYAVSSGTEIKNIDLIQELCCMVADKAGLSRIRLMKQLSFVADRPGHDRRYALDSSKISRTLGWKPSTDFKEGLHETVLWYLAQR